jgi:hypothetical protein
MNRPVVFDDSQMWRTNTNVQKRESGILANTSAVSLVLDFRSCIIRSDADLHLLNFGTKERSRLLIALPGNCAILIPAVNTHFTVFSTIHP